MGNGIFICYRSADAEATAGRIHDELVRRYGNRRVFRAPEAISGGEDFKSRIRRALAACSHFILIIGPKWEDSFRSGSPGESEVDQDYVLSEILVARELMCRILPVLVDGASQPDWSRLPQEIHFLSDLQTTEIRPGQGFPRDLDHLTRQLPRRFQGKAFAAALAVAVGGLIAWRAWPNEGGAQGADRSLQDEGRGLLARDDRATTKEDTEVIIDVLGNDFGVEALEQIAVKPRGEGIQGSLREEDGKIVYQPPRDLAPTEVFRYVLERSDGATSDAMVTVEVEPENDPPTHPDLTVDTPWCKETLFDVLSNIEDVEGDAVTLQRVVLVEGWGEPSLASEHFQGAGRVASPENRQRLAGFLWYPERASACEPIPVSSTDPPTARILYVVADAAGATSEGAITIRATNPELAAIQFDDKLEGSGLHERGIVRIELPLGETKGRFKANLSPSRVQRTINLRGKEYRLSDLCQAGFELYWTGEGNGDWNLDLEVVVELEGAEDLRMGRRDLSGIGENRIRYPIEKGLRSALSISSELTAILLDDE